jgi:peptide/nickel transport system ATP-binding protein
LQVTSSTLSAVFSAYSEASATSSSASKKRSWFKRAAAWASAPQVEVEVLRDLSLSVHAGEIVAVVGASGSGKTLLADSLLGLFDPHARVSGTIWFDGVEQTAASLAALRGREIALVPQSVAALDPLMKVGRQVEEVVQGGMRDARDAGMQAAASRNQAAASRNQDATSRALRRQQLFARYGLSEDVANLYPHELSGGMLRRVLLCCALMQNPRLIVADEPTPGLDLKRAVQALADLRDFANEGGGVVLITHDISLALTVADRVAVFKDGTVVEETAVANFASPNTLRHPFTRALWHALPENDFCVVEEGAATCDTVSNSEESERNKSLNGDDVVCSYAPSAEEGADSKASNTEEGAPC